MFLLTGFLSFISSFFSTPDASKLEPEHPLLVGEEMNGRYVAPEVRKIFPKEMLFLGCTNMIGVENLTLSLNFEKHTLSDYEKLGYEALAAAKLGLLKTKKLYNYTNHGPNSPYLIYIDIIGKTRNEGACIYGGKFLIGNNQKEANFLPVEPDTILYKAVIDSFQDLNCTFSERGLSYYTTYIEPDVPAIGLCLTILLEKVPSIEESVSLYKNYYGLLSEKVKSIYPNHFLMVRLSLGTNISPRTHRIWLLNIRNHLLLSEDIPIEINGRFENMKSYGEWHLDLLNDFIPTSLHREFYRENTP